MTASNGANSQIHKTREKPALSKPGHRRYFLIKLGNETNIYICTKVEHRVRQFEAWLADTLENFRIHQEGLISRVPKLVRGLTMREFGEKYKGDVQAALRGMQREKMGAAGAEVGTEIDKSTRKRKWVASQEVGTAVEGSKNTKNGVFSIYLSICSDNG